jgi:hypothetical protein
MANNYPGSIKSVMKFRPKKNRKINWHFLPTF